ncbi:MAG: hypothetical protein QM731_18150 [Chitinophagaceae bacterium]
MKKFCTAIITCVLFSTIATAQSSFPADFVGHWKGTLNWYPSGAKEPKQITMELHVQPSKDTAGQYTWNLVYGKPSEDNRPYILKPVDTAKGHWVIDEVNGIKLDQYWIGNAFSGAFRVENSTIVNTYWLENGRLKVQFISYLSKPVATTGKGTEESPFVDSYGVRSYQLAELTKQ